MSISNFEIIKKEVRPFKVEVKCNKLGCTGTLVYDNDTGCSLSCNPPMYYHNCTKCDNGEFFTEKYPKIEYEEVNTWKPHTEEEEV